ncbi:MAG: AAA family ATPase [Bacteroidales bacterium]
MQNLIASYHRLLENTPTDFIRYLHDKIEWDSRLIAILGARGVGKTTMLLQHIKLFNDINKTLFVSADDLYFAKHTLFDLALTFYQDGGKYLYIDEIHKYRNWSIEIKNIYDQIPQLNVIYTGSSILDLEKLGGDLSRRKLQYYLYGLSFREYIEMSKHIKVPINNFDYILANKIDFPYKEIRPVQLFNEYIKSGYYPFYAEKEYYRRLNNIVNQTLEVDIPQFAGMNVGTSRKLKQLLYIIAKSVPFKPNYSKLAINLDISRNSLKDILFYLEKAGMIGQLRSETGGVKLLGKVDKVMLDNTNLSYALSAEETNIGNIRETFFYATMKVTQRILTSKVSDFTIGKYTFEIGGKNKGQKQILTVKDGYIVKDNIEYGYKNIIPLWAFGLTY